MGNGTRGVGRWISTRNCSIATSTILGGTPDGRRVVKEREVLDRTILVWWVCIVEIPGEWGGRGEVRIKRERLID